MDYLTDYWTYNSRYEILRNYAFWCGITLIGACVHRKVYCLIGDEEVHGNLYTLLVGPQGNHKSFPCNLARKMFERVRPGLEIGASTQSAEDIVTEMCKDHFIRGYKNELGEMIEVRPYAFFINEFKNFIAYNPVRVLNFLGDIYDTKTFKSGTIKRGLEVLVNPSINILACENPNQLIKFMKSDVMTGGLSRRFIVVYETSYDEPKPEVVITSEAREAWLRVEKRLIDCDSVVGLFKFSAEGQKYFNSWYIENHKKATSTTSEVMKGYLSTKGTQLRKVAMLLDVVSDKPMLLFTPDLLQLSLFHLDALEENMPLLSISAGRNDMMGPQQKMLEILRNNGGYMPEKTLMKEIEGELKPFEIINVISHLIDTDQVVKKQWKVRNSQGVEIPRWLIFLPETYEEAQKNGAITVSSKIQPKDKA